VSVLFEGNGANNLFKNEAGGHRWQRCPPTEKRGRVHTSTVTVAVLDASSAPKFKLNESELEITTTRGTGPGGQHRNTTDSCVIVRHLPTGITAKIDCRSQHQSRALALRILADRIEEEQRQQWDAKRAAKRKNQVGSGQRGDKIRTYREKDDRVVDHRTGQKWKLTKWMRGDW
jgi:peptide chain release factor 1